MHTDGKDSYVCNRPPPGLVQMFWACKGAPCEHVRTQMGEYEYIPDPFQEQRQPRQSGGDGRVPFRPPRLVSDACFALYEVRRHAAHLMQLLASQGDKYGALKYVMLYTMQPHLWDTTTHVQG